jgi:hypothetical protein
VHQGLVERQAGPDALVVVRPAQNVVETLLDRVDAAGT